MQIELEVPTSTIPVKYCRECLSKLLDQALESKDCLLAVKLSHCVAWLSALQDAGVD